MLNLLSVPGLSNFSPWGLTTLEHKYQAAKTHDPHEKTHIMQAPSPQDAKKRGRKATLVPRWEQRKISVMANLLREKFAEGTDFAAILLSTGDARLQEQNTWHDTFWGICTGECQQGPHKPEGQNWLGVLQMERRTFLAAKTSGAANKA